MTEPNYTSLAWSSQDGNPNHLEAFLGAWDYRIYYDDLKSLFAIAEKPVRRTVKHPFRHHSFIVVLQLVNGLPQEWHVYKSGNNAMVAHEIWGRIRYAQLPLKEISDLKVIEGKSNGRRSR